MKTFIPLLGVLIASVLAEPPVNDGYALSRSSYDHDHASQEYGPPSVASARNSLSTEYGPPSSRSAGLRNPSQKYGAPAARSSISRSYGAPSLRSQGSAKSISQEYGAPNARSSLSQEYGLPNARNGISQEYGVPNARAISQEYGAPSARSGISQEYGVPSSRSGISEEYGAPSARSGISQEYGLPNVRSISQEYGLPNARRISQEYSAPNARSSLSEEYGHPAFRSSEGYNDLSARTLSTEYGVPDARSTPSQTYGAPELARSKSSFRSNQGSTFSKSTGYSSPSLRSNEVPHSAKTVKPFGRSSTPLSSYGSPSARNSDTYAQNFKSISSSYLPTQRDLSDNYGVPSSRDLSQEYGLPSSRADLKTNAIVSSYSDAAASARSSPSSTYGAPSARSMPSNKYGTPEQYDAQSNQGYNYARGALDDLVNQEPANYDFAYKVNDYETGSDFGHTETRQDNHAEGSYFVVLPDGTKQTVEYEADERGFKPRISVEPADVSTRSGYDDNAADLARSDDGPY